MSDSLIHEKDQGFKVLAWHALCRTVATDHNTRETFMKKRLNLSTFVILAAFAGACNNSTLEEDQWEQGVIDFEAGDYEATAFSLSGEQLVDVYEGVFSADFDLSTYEVAEDDHPKCMKIVDRMKRKQVRYLKRQDKMLKGKGDAVLLAERNKQTKNRAFKLLRRAMMSKFSCSIADKIVDKSLLLEQDHIINGSFELRPIKQGSWNYYSQKQTPGWRIDVAAGADACDDQARLNGIFPAVEFQTAGTRVLSADDIHGRQFAELDSHCHSQRGNDTRVSIYQKFPTIPGQVYKLSFNASSRDKAGKLVIRTTDVDRKSLTYMEAANHKFTHVYKDDQTGLLNREMKRYVYYFTAKSELTEIRFSDEDEMKKTFGVLLDNVSVVGVGIKLSSLENVVGANAAAARSHVENILTKDYPTDAAIQGPIKFYSLGLGGSLEGSYTTPIERATGGRTPRIKISEITYGDNAESTKACGSYLETMNFFHTSESGEKQVKIWHKEEQRSQTELCGDQYFNVYSNTTIEGSTLSGFRMVDTTVHEGRDGFDIDAITLTLDD